MKFKNLAPHRKILLHKMIMKYCLIVLLSSAMCLRTYAQAVGLTDIFASMEASKIHQDSIDSSILIAVYDYKCTTQDAEGKIVNDMMKLCLQVGAHCTRCFPYRKFRMDTHREERDYMEGYDFLYDDEMPLFQKESLCFMPEVWINYPYRKITVRDAIPPIVYETQEMHQPIDWKLTDDTITICGYLCKTAMCNIYGRKWMVCYTEEIPSTAGPWKLYGLPGMIVDAVSEGDTHRFSLIEARQIVSTIYSERSAITTKITEKKLTKNKIKTFGNRLYLKDPLYYAQDVIKNANTVFCKTGILVNGIYVNNKTHKYQPLELK